MRNNVGEFIQWGTTVLSKAGLEDAEREAQTLLSGVIQKPRTMLFLDKETPVSKDEAWKFEKAIERRSRFEPVAYIEGQTEFYGLNIEVSNKVLIPRPETELLVEKVITRASYGGSRPIKILEIGTGSGCMAIAMAKNLPRGEVVTVDISPEALSIAQNNARNNGVEGQIRFYKSDIYKDLGQVYKGYFDIIISNPPYISELEMAGLDPDLSFEPKMALQGGADGYQHISAIVKEAKTFLNQKGFIALEIGFSQGDKTAELMRSAGFVDIKIAKDYSGHNRIVSGVLSGSI